MDNDLEHLRTIMNTQSQKIENLELKMKLAAEFLTKALEAIANLEEKHDKIG